MSKEVRFRRTPKEIKEGLTVEQAKEKRDSKKWEAIAQEATKENEALPKEMTQEALEAKHEANPTIEVTVGAGDIVGKITKATGIKALVEYFTPEGEDCGCDERKEKLNKFPILKNRRHIECLTLDEYNYLTSLNLFNNQAIQGKDVKRLQTIYERVFNMKLGSSCSGCSFAKKLDELKAVLKTYQDEY